MKKALILIAILISAKIKAQEFMGIKVEGTKSEIISRFKEKGFKIRSADIKNIIPFYGELGTQKIEVNVVFTAKSGLAWKFAVYLPEQSSWYSLKNDYEQYLAVMTSKYGEPDKTYSTFLNPYYEGDGYEMSAVGIDKCLYYASWKDYYTIEITKYKQVKISYYNPTNSQIDDKEKNQIQTNAF
jgi:hypothetical protein